MEFEEVARPEAEPGRSAKMEVASGSPVADQPQPERAQPEGSPSQVTKPMSREVKRGIAVAGLILAVLGSPMMLSICCLTPLLTLEGERGAIGVGLFSFTFVVVTVGGGGATFLHALRSLQGRKSGPLRLPAAWALAGLFGFFVAAGLLISGTDFAPGLFFPPILLVAAALPPLLAVSWFTGPPLSPPPGNGGEGWAEGLTWRRGLVAFAGGATGSVAIAILLEILLPLVVLSLVSELAGAARESLEALFEALAGTEVASAITSPGFIFVFVEIAVIAPLAEEFAKPLVTLPLVSRLSRRDAFLVAAMAGAGFAALENVIYAGFGFYFWAGILVVRALGGAIHPLGSGLVGLGWRDILNSEPNAWLRWLMRFSLAAGVHALWNGGSLLVITLAGAQFFGELPPEIDVLGLSAAGTTLALLIVLGLAALWMGRTIAQRPALSRVEGPALSRVEGPALSRVEGPALSRVEGPALSFAEGAMLPGVPGAEPVDLEFTLSDRTVAIWALACLAAIVPVGITSLQLLMR